MSQPSSPDIKTISSLEVQKKDKPAPCDAEEDVSVNYTIVGESPGSVDVIYLVSYLWVYYKVEHDQTFCVFAKKLLL